MKNFILSLVLAVLVIASLAPSANAQYNQRIVGWNGSHAASATDFAGPWWYGPFDISECVNDSGNFVAWLAAVGNSVLGTNVDSVALYYGATALAPTTVIGTGSVAVGLDFLVSTVPASKDGVVLVTDGTAVVMTPACKPALQTLAAGKVFPHYVWVKIVHVYASGLTHDNFTYFEGGCIKLSAATTWRP